MSAYYNENDRRAAAWLRELIREGHIAPGDVDERSIVEVRPADLEGYTQCHFFAGIGGWSAALRIAGWPDDRPVWTGSCPCQPFSDAGKGAELDDERHLWPAWFGHIRERRPVTCFGEQVASKDGLAWLDIVSTDLESEGYTIGTVDTCAAGFGAPHIRQRFYFVAHPESARRARREYPGALGEEEGERARLLRIGGHGETCLLAQNSGLGNAERTRLERLGRHVDHGHEPGRHGENASRPAPAASHACSLDNAERDGRRAGRNDDAGHVGLEPHANGAVNGFWGNAEWLACRDGFSRAVEPGSFPLAHGVPERVGLLRGYGNAIVTAQAAEFIAAAKELL